MEKHYTITTLGSHSALQILKGAKDEGFNTLLIALHKNVNLYKRFSFIDTIITIDSYAEVTSLEKKLKKFNCIVIPHGSFVAYLGSNKIPSPYFGNLKVLDWEEDRILQRKWIEDAQVQMPKEYTKEHAKFPVIVKLYGAAGGTGYVIAGNEKELLQKIKPMQSTKFTIQQYIVGVTCYLHYFYSPITNKIELMSIDRRYETNADGLGRIPHAYQKNNPVDPSFVVVGNSPLVIRESLLEEVYSMGERIVASSKKLIDHRGMVGPFCIETIITPDQKFYAIELSARIVAGTNLYTYGSPYTWLQYDEPMSTGRRIAREITIAMKKNMIRRILD